MDKNCGIYKITSPSGKIYIGQSLNIRRRFRDYKTRVNCAQKILLKSFNKYGVNNHQFDIIEYCTMDELNCSERFWQDEFDALGKNGLNCLLTPCNSKRYQHSEDTLIAMSERMKGSNNPMYGKTFSEEHKNKLKGKRESMSKGNHPLAKKVININTGKIWNCISDAAEDNNISHRTLRRYLNNPEKNPTNLKIY
jgi:group I intron endonuclease